MFDKTTSQRFIKIDGVELPILYRKEKEEYYNKIVETIERELNNIRTQLRSRGVQVSVVQLAFIVSMAITEKYLSLREAHGELLDDYKNNIRSISEDLVEVSAFIDTYINTAN